MLISTLRCYLEFSWNKHAEKLTVSNIGADSRERMTTKETQRKQDTALRSAYKGHCTRDFKKAESLMQSKTPDVEELSNILEYLERRTNEIRELDTKIAISYADDVEIEAAMEDTLLYNDQISSWKSTINSLLKGLASARQPPVRPVQLESSFQAHSSASFKHGTTVKLPKLVIKPFSGDPLEWLTFWNSFKSSVHENTEISDIDKTNYLRGYLSGEAAKAIAGLPLRNANYDKAVEFLKQRFGRSQTLINSYMNALTKLPNITNNVKQLRNFYDSLENYIRGLEALGTETSSYGNLLIPIIMGKIPEEIRRIMFRSNPLVESCLDQLRASLLNEIESREKGRLVVNQTLIPETEHEESYTPTAQALTSGALSTKQSGNSFKRKLCAYCNGSHRSDQCDKKTTVEDRIAFLRRTRKCFNCLGTNHMSDRCNSKGRCRHCKKKHHTSISYTTKEKLPSEPDTPAPKSIGTPASTQQSPTGIMKASSTSSAIILQFAMVTAMGKYTDCQCRAIFDTGAQRSFVIEKIVNKLQLETIGEEEIVITTFVQTNEGQNQTYKIVSITLVSENENFKISALVSKVICPPIKYQTPHFPEKIANLKLADPKILNTKSLDVDILIGNDNYSSLVTGEVTKLHQKGLMAMNSRFG